jgi:formylmethanofuran dehydrogenase subunit E
VVVKNSSAKEKEPVKEKIFRGKVKCSKCGEMGYMQSSYKCSSNGTKKKASDRCIICKLFALFLHIEMFNCLTNAL